MNGDQAIPTTPNGFTSATASTRFNTRWRDEELHLRLEDVGRVQDDRVGVDPDADEEHGGDGDDERGGHVRHDAARPAPEDDVAERQQRRAAAEDEEEAGGDADAQAAADPRQVAARNASPYAGVIGASSTNNKP